MNLTYDKKGTRLIIATLAELAQNSINNTPPDNPNIIGPTKGKPDVELVYNFSSIDPENHVIYYFIDWSDGTNTGWIGPYNSSEEISLGHVWEDKGTYIIKAKAKDLLGEDSEWGTLEISIPRIKIINEFHIIKFLKRLANIFPCLKNLLLN
jgi:hypothetical protein